MDSLFQELIYSTDLCWYVSPSFGILIPLHSTETNTRSQPNWLFHLTTLLTSLLCSFKCFSESAKSSNVSLNLSLAKSSPIKNGLRWLRFCSLVILWVRCFIFRAPKISERSTEPFAETKRFKRSTSKKENKKTETNGHIDMTCYRLPYRLPLEKLVAASEPFPS